jgi:hypothetical protein
VHTVTLQHYLAVKLSDARLRRHRAKLLYPNHRLPPWLPTELTLCVSILLGTHRGNETHSCWTERAKQGETYTLSGICHGKSPAFCAKQESESAESFARNIALRFLLRASPGCPSLATRRSHAFDPGTAVLAVRTATMGFVIPCDRSNRLLGEPAGLI